MRGLSMVALCEKEMIARVVSETVAADTFNVLMPIVWMNILPKRFPAWISTWRKVLLLSG